MAAVYEHGYAFARSLAFYNKTLFWQWMRLPGDVVFALAALMMAWDFLIKLRPLLDKGDGAAAADEAPAAAPATVGEV